MSEWFKARKKPVEISWRYAVESDEDMIQRKEGGEIFEKLGVDSAQPAWPYYNIIKGVSGEVYPIEKKIFNQTYEVI